MTAGLSWLLPSATVGMTLCSGDRFEVGSWTDHLTVALGSRKPTNCGSTIINREIPILSPTATATVTDRDSEEGG